MATVVLSAAVVSPGRSLAVGGKWAGCLQCIPVFAREMSQRRLFEHTLWLERQKEHLLDEEWRCTNLLNRMLPPTVVKQLLVRAGRANSDGIATQCSLLNAALLKMLMYVFCTVSDGGMCSRTPRR